MFRSFVTGLVIVAVTGFGSVAAQTSPSRRLTLVFEGNSRISNRELRDYFTKCTEGAWKTYEAGKYQYFRDIFIRRFYWSRGFLKAVVHEAVLLSSGNRYKVTFKVEEGPRFRWGKITVDGVSTERAISILEKFGQTEGDIANGKLFTDFVYDTLHAEFAERGHVHYTAEFEPELIDPPGHAADGTANVLVTIDPGPLFRVNRVLFDGVSSDESRKLVDSFPLRKDDIFIQSRLYGGIKKLNGLRKYENVDKDADVELRTDEEGNIVDVHILLRPRKK